MLEKFPLICRNILVWAADSMLNPFTSTRYSLFVFIPNHVWYMDRISWFDQAAIASVFMTWQSCFSGSISIPNTKWKPLSMVILGVHLLPSRSARCLLEPSLVWFFLPPCSKFLSSENTKYHQWQLLYLALTVEWRHLSAIQIFKIDFYNRW